MARIEDRYISLLTDFGFKRIFGTELNSELLIGFLNCLFEGQQVVKSVTYLNAEHLGDISVERKAIFDVYCENEKGEKFIVEMQNAYQKNFKERTLFYSTFPIREQAQKGEWDFNLERVYTIAIMNFNLEEKSFDENEIKHEVKLCDTYTKRVFSEKLNFIFVEVAKFNKTEDELESTYDKWLYVLKNLSRLSNRPKVLQERIFDRLFQQAEIAHFNPEEQRAYEDSMKAYRDIKNSIDTAREEGIEIGLEKGREEKAIEIARNMKALGVSVEIIASSTGLTAEEINAI